MLLICVAPGYFLPLFNVKRKIIVSKIFDMVTKLEKWDAIQQIPYQNPEESEDEKLIVVKIKLRNGVKQNMPTGKWYISKVLSDI